jgi:hypothetical protein
MPRFNVVPFGIMKIAIFLNVRAYGAVAPAVFLLCLLFEPDDGDNILLRNNGKLQPDCMASYLRT